MWTSKSNGFIEQNNNFARASRFFVHSIALLARLWRKQASTIFFFLSLNLSAVPKKSTPGKFAYIRHFQGIGINATVSEKTRIHHKNDVFAAVFVDYAKGPTI